MTLFGEICSGVSSTLASVVGMRPVEVVKIVRWIVVDDPGGTVVASPVVVVVPDDVKHDLALPCGTVKVRRRPTT